MVFGEFERVVDAADGQHADGASRAMHEGDVFGHQSRARHNGKWRGCARRRTP